MWIQLVICAENQVHLSNIVFISQKKETWPVRSKRCIKTQTVLPSAETAAMLFCALLASGQISVRKVDGGKRSPLKWPPSAGPPGPLS